MTPEESREIFLDGILTKKDNKLIDKSPHLTKLCALYCAGKIGIDELYPLLRTSGE
jgi:hypothetical protein